jgi:DNA-binding Xre family transcriptional regulator
MRNLDACDTSNGQGADMGASGPRREAVPGGIVDTIGGRVAALMKRSGMTPVEIERRTGINRVTVYSIVNSKRKISPRLDTLEGICGACGATVPDLYGIDPAMI